MICVDLNFLVNTACASKEWIVRPIAKGIDNIPIFSPESLM